VVPAGREHAVAASANSPTYRADDALLTRESLLQAAQSLRERWNAPVFRAGCRAPLGVTVTRVHPENLRSKA